MEDGGGEWRTRIRRRARERGRFDNMQERISLRERERERG